VKLDWSCPACGAANRPQAVFCAACGSRRDESATGPSTSAAALPTGPRSEGAKPGLPPPLERAPSPAPIGAPYPTPRRTGLPGAAWAAIGAGGVLVVAGIVALVLILGDPSTTATASDQSGSGTQGTTSAGSGSGNSGGRSSSSDDSGSGSGSSTSTTTSDSGNAGSSGAGQAPVDSASPSGMWTQYYDASTGFAIWYPTGWTIDPTTDGVFFRDPGVNAYLLAAYITPAGPSALQAWQQQEPTFASQHSDYQRVSMSGDAQQATWEYTYTDNGTGMHGIDWGAVVDNGQYGFALNWVTDDADWSGLQTTFQGMEQSFVPPGG
jgi:hypothetical protein